MAQRFQKKGSGSLCPASTKDGSEGKVCPECAHNERRTKLSMMDELNNCSHNVSFLQSMVQDDEIPKKFLESITDKSIALSMKFSHRKHITQIINKFIKF